MDLVLEVISTQKYDEGFPVRKIFHMAGGLIGRSPDCDWCLPDRQRLLSKKHALITYEGGVYYIEDISSNGIILEDTRTPLEGEKIYPVRHGQRYRMGPLLIQVSLEQDPSLFSQETDFRLQGGKDIIPDDDFLDNDPIKALAREEELSVSRAWTRADMEKRGAERGFDFIQVDGPAEYEVTQSKGPSVLDNIPTPAPPRRPVSPAAMPLPRPTPTAEHPVFPARELMAAAPPPLPAQSDEISILLGRLGMGNLEMSPEERIRLVENLADVVRAALGGILKPLRTRAEIKNELRLGMTMIRATGNNPLKFSHSFDHAADQLLLHPTPGNMSAGEAMRDALASLQTHQLALMAGCRSALLALLQKLSPEELMRQVDDGGFFSGDKEKRCWKRYRKLHAAMMDDAALFQNLYQTAFYMAYEDQLRLLADSKERLLED